MRDPQGRIPDRAKIPEGVRFAAANGLRALVIALQTTLKVLLRVADRGNDAPVGELTAITSCGTARIRRRARGLAASAF
jgi:signal transduction histidine kinase